MNEAPENFMSRDAVGFMDKITDLMDEEENVVIGPPGSSNAIMVPVKHVGNRPERTDNVANTGLKWHGNETLLVPEQKAVLLLKYPDVWAFDKEYLDANAGTNYEGRVPLVIYVTTDDFAALSSGAAEVMVIHADESKPVGRADANLSLNEELAALDKAGLLAYAESHGVKLDKRLAEPKLREQLLLALAGDAIAQENEE